MGAGSLFQTIMGGIQMVRGMRMKPVRPTYQTPEEVNQMMANAQMQQYAKAPGVSAAEANLRLSAAQTMASVNDAATSGASALAAGAAVNARLNNEYMRLGAQQNAFRLQQQQAYNQALMSKAQYTDREFEINQYQPFLDAAQTKAALTQGGMQNIFGGLNGLGNAAMAGIYAQKLDKG